MSGASYLIGKMNKKQELNQKLLLFNPEIAFDSTVGGIKLVMKVNPYNEQIHWVVYEGDHCSEFNNFQDACAYYVKAIGAE